jgi:hypothetical protein
MLAPLLIVFTFDLIYSACLYFSCYFFPSERKLDFSLLDKTMHDSQETLNPIFTGSRNPILLWYHFKNRIYEIYGTCGIYDFIQMETFGTMR